MAGAGSAAQGIFISYRRSEAQMAAGRLADALIREFGDEHVFRDIEDISPGADFVATLDRALAACRVMLVVMGPQWLDVRAGDGTRRLDRADDWVRQEIARALQQGVRVIPILLERTEMPGDASLPADIQPLARRQAVTLADAHWARDVAALIQALRPGAGAPPQAQAVPVQSQAAMALAVGSRIGAGVRTGVTWLRRIMIAFGLLIVGLIAITVKACVAETPDLAGPWRSAEGWQLQFEPVDKDGVRHYQVQGRAGRAVVQCDGAPALFGSLDLDCRLMEGGREADRITCSGLYVSEDPLGVSGDCKWAGDGSTRKLALTR